jgi:CO/xanthine dehydrogenase Mo-binding subunit
MRSPETSSDLLPQAARRDFLRAGGALVVGLSLAACATPEGSGVRSGMRALPLRLREPQSTPPAADRVDSFLVIHEDSTVTLYTGFAELGQGTTTSLLQIAAEELDLGMDQIRAAPLDTHLSPNQGGTYSSASVQRGRPQITAAAAEARRALLALAATPPGRRCGTAERGARPGSRAQGRPQRQLRRADRRPAIRAVDHRQGAGQGQHRIPPGGGRNTSAPISPPSSPASRCTSSSNACRGCCMRA